MITDITNVSSKSFENYSSTEKFGIVNVIFGTNGSGKSALSKWLYNQAADGVRLFDTNYIKANILARNEIAGVKLTIGKNAVNLEEMTNNIENANINIKSQKEQLANDITNINKQIFNILDTTLQQAKKQFNLSKQINQKVNAKSNPINAYKLWLNDIDDTLVLNNSSEDLEKEKSALLERKNQINTIFNFSEAYMPIFLEKMRKPIAIPSNEVSSQIATWILDGIHLHDMQNRDEICEFCGNTFNGLDVGKVIFEKTSTEHAKLIKELSDFESNLVECKQKINQLPYMIKKSEIIDNVDRILEYLNRKINNSNEVINVEKELVSNFFDFDKMLQNCKNDLNEKITEITQQLNKIESVAKSWIGRQLKENDVIKSSMATVFQMKKKYDDLENVYHENQSWLSEQQNTNSDLKPFCDLVNHEFLKIGLDFKLEIMNDNQHYLVKHKSLETIITTEDLSEGERRLLGFLHFYYDLFDKPDESFVSNVELILIDDPITSLDVDNRYYLTELINSFIKSSVKLGKQLFVFTHSSIDFHNFSYASKNSVTFWKIRKNILSQSELTKLLKDDIKNYSDYYQNNFRDVYDFATLKKDKLPENNFIQFGNKTRLLLESHARTHYKMEYVTAREYGKIKEYYQVEDSNLDELKKSLDIINSLSHGLTFADEFNLSASEIQQGVRFIISMLFKKDKWHVQQMAGISYDYDKQSNWLEIN